MKNFTFILFFTILGSCGIYDKNVFGNYTIIPIEEEPKVEAAWNYHNEFITDNFLTYKETPTGFKTRYYLGDKITLTENTPIYLNIKNNYSYHKASKGYWPLLPLFPYYFRTDEYNECGKKFPIPIEITVNKDNSDDEIILFDFHIILKDGKRVNPIMVHNKIRRISFPMNIGKAMKATSYPKPNTFEFSLYCNQLDEAEVIIEADVNGEKHINRSRIIYKEDITTGRYVVFLSPIVCAITKDC